ncbi:MAG: polysaccharide deacetylase family protein [Halieaceae bacterium]|jgi:peptidoglycan/xylan/chitin deacetylase (PgdA/CDA1 family)|nr:polysaccharide deacetylase family protein [Halieaceae bacterium]
MVLILMYHRVHGVGATTDALRQHLRYLTDHHPLVWPGDSLPGGELSVCLTFDDANVDFLHEVYPLLDELNAKAIVAVPTRYIEADTKMTMQARLEAQGKALMSGDYANTGSPLCTWAELKLMQDSGRVQCASHGHNHANLCSPGAHLDMEIGLSRELLSKHLKATPRGFVFPYGKTRRDITDRVLTEYRYAMRIGSALNPDWDSNGGLLYRVDAEHFWPKGRVWSFRELMKYRLKYLSNRLRNK